MPIFANDRALLDAFRKGDTAALTRVYWHYVDAVARLVRFGFFVGEQKQRMAGVRDAMEQSDLLQEVFARAFSEKARIAYDGVKPYRPYLLRIAKNLMIDRARAGGREVPASDSLEAWADENETLAAADADFDHDPKWQSLTAATKDFVTTLSASERRFVELRFIDERSQYEIADTLGTTRGKVRQLEGKLARGLRLYLRKRGLP